MTQQQHTMEEQQPALVADSVMVRVTCGSFNPQVKHKGESAKVVASAAASKDAARVICSPIPKEWAQPLENIQARARAWRDRHASPWDGDWYIMNAELLPEFLDGMNTIVDEFRAVLANQMDEYPNIVAKAKATRMGGLYRDDQYPSAEVAAGRWVLDWGVEPLNLQKPDFRVQCSASQLNQLRTKYEIRIKDSLKVLEASLYDRLAKAAGACCIPLRPDAERIKSSVFDTLGELVDMEPQLNLGNAPEVHEAYRRADKIFLSRPVNTLRDDDNLRASVYQAGIKFVTSLPGWEDALSNSRFVPIMPDLVKVAGPTPEPTPEAPPPPPPPPPPPT